jgi:hypothetical protein
MENLKTVSERVSKPRSLIGPSESLLAPSPTEIVFWKNSVIELLFWNRQGSNSLLATRCQLAARTDSRDNPRQLQFNSKNSTLRSFNFWTFKSTLLMTSSQQKYHDKAGNLTCDGGRFLGFEPLVRRAQLEDHARQFLTTTCLSGRTRISSDTT